MFFNSIIICLTFILSLNRIQCQLIFEDDFTEFDSSKWEIISIKADCGSNIYALDQQQKDICNTNNEVNVRTLSGTLALTANKESYFGRQFTTATLATKETFNLGSPKTSLYIKIRAALPAVKGLISRIDLVSLENRHKRIKTRKDISVICYKETLWNNLDTTQTENLTEGIEIEDFQEYEIILEDLKIIYKLNGKDLLTRVLSPINPVDRDFKLVITLDIDKEKYENSNSFIIDYVKLYRYNPENNYLDKIKPTANEIITEIRDLNNHAYVKFSPSEEYSALIFQDEFSGSSLDQTKWNVEHNDISCKDPGLKCKPTIHVSDGSLKLSITNETNHGHIIASRPCFSNSRIEIRAKMPKAKGLVTHLYLQSYEQGCYNRTNVKGRVVILGEFGSYYASEVHIAQHKANHEIIDQELSDYQIYGIEWNTNYIQWFINDRVVYQANRLIDMNGKSMIESHQAWFLPFDHVFNLLFYTGVLSKNLATEWVTPELDIDYVRVYAEKELISEQASEQVQESTSHAIVLTSICILVAILVVLSIIYVVYFFRKKSRNNLQQDEISFHNL